MLPIILISCLGIIAYSNTFHDPFHFDDFLFITGNFYIRNIHDLAGLWNYYPCRFLTFLSLALNYHFGQYDVFGYHLFNCAVHVCSAFLVRWFVLLTLSTPAMKEKRIARDAGLIALCAGIIFVAHPVTTEAVTNIWQRAASMVTLFYLASLCLYARSRRQPQGASGSLYYACSLMMAAAAMFTKEIAITLPLMALLYEFTFLRTGRNIDWKHITPLLCTVFIIPLTGFLTSSIDFQHRQLAVEGPVFISTGHYFLTELRVMITYIRLAFFPVNQSLDYDYHVSQNIFEIPTLLSFFALIAILFGAVRLFSKYRLLSFCVFWFFLALLPESSFIPLNDVIFEHRLYLPLVGYSIFLASGIYYLFGEKGNLKAMAAVLAVIVACYAVLTYQRNGVWKDNLT
jgi:protein O-mannosyl-transferase